MTSMSVYILITTSIMLLVMFFYILFLSEKKAIHYVNIALTMELLVWSISVLVGHFFQENAQIFVFMDNFAYIGAAFVPPSLVLFALVYRKGFTGFRKVHSLLFVVPIITIIVVFTNGYHHLFYESYSLETGYVLGPYFYTYVLYSYGCLLISMLMLSYSAIKSSGILSAQALLILLASVIPTWANIGYTFSFPGFSVYSTPIAFTITLALYLLSMFRFDFLKVVPAATQTVINRISDCFVLLDEEFNLIDYNKAFSDRFLPKVKGKNKFKLTEVFDSVDLSDEQQKSIFNNIDSAFLKGEMCTEDLVVDGEMKYYYSVEYTQLLEMGQQTSLVILFRDVTQHVLDLQVLQENQAVLLERERLASLGQMIGGIAHNLKSPILSVSGGIDQLRYLVEEYQNSIGDEEINDDDHRDIARDMDDWLAKMKVQVSYMSDIITTVKGQAAQFNEEDRYPFTIKDVLKRSQILTQHSLIENNCTLEAEVNIDSLQMIYGDINSLVQILDNVIENAIQAYGNQGGAICVVVEQIGKDVKFSITDFGEGIAPSVQKLLFKEMTTTKGKHGTGLGLYMSYSTVKGLFRGNMWFESTPARGTTFFVQIPLATE